MRLVLSHRQVDITRRILAWDPPACPPTPSPVVQPDSPLLFQVRQDSSVDQRRCVSFDLFFASLGFFHSSALMHVNVVLSFVDHPWTLSVLGMSCPVQTGRIHKTQHKKRTAECCSLAVSRRVDLDAVELGFLWA
jgi:hypothetical protein